MHPRSHRRLTFLVSALLLVSLACSLPSQLGTPSKSPEQQTLEAVGTRVAMQTAPMEVPSATEPGAATAAPEATLTP